MRYNNQKKNKPKNRKTKELLIFDEKAREEFLTGFSKRKKNRQKKAQEEINKKLKEERQLLKQKRKEFSQGNLKGKYQSAPVDIEDVTDTHVTDLPEHTVTITDVSEVDLIGQGGIRLGLNKFKEEEEETAAMSDDESQVPETSKQISKGQQQQILRNIGAKINKRQKHVKLKTQHKKGQKGKKGRVLSKKMKHHRKPQS